ncbi:MAG: hypothetical protein FWF96_03420, partial [Kiritimatiellaeota bacterium]|nr:hypothetical protein [Kiritimatiellota bacterium]
MKKHLPLAVALFAFVISGAYIGMTRFHTTRILKASIRDTENFRREFQASLDERNAKLAQLENTLAERDATIAKLEAALAGRDATIASLSSPGAWEEPAWEESVWEEPAPPARRGRNNLNARQNMANNLQDLAADPERLADLQARGAAFRERIRQAVENREADPEALELFDQTGDYLRLMQNFTPEER